jgi:hypothetical protein
MAFSGLDDMISEMAAGKKQRIRSNRIANTGATSAAGRWHECFAISNGTGGIGVLTGTAGVGVACDASRVGALPLNPINVTPDTRHVQAMMCVTPAATLVPGLCNLIDILYIYPSCVVTTGAGTTISNAAGKPARFANGKDVKLGAIVAGTALGAASPLITVTYTDQDGNTGNSGFLSAAANSLPIGALLSGAAIAVPGSPEMLFAAGDTGVRDLVSYTTAGGTTGTVTFFLYRDLAEVPIIAANLGGERDYLTQIPSLPTVDDNACLTFLVLAGGALTANNPIIATVQFAWG